MPVSYPEKDIEGLANSEIEGREGIAKSLAFICKYLWAMVPRA